MKDFSNDATMAQLQGISVQLDGSPTYLSLQILEAYKEVRRCLPREGNFKDARHIGADAAHSATQGDELPRNLTNQG